MVPGNAVLRLQLLGVPAISLDGAPVPFERRGSLALLAYLAVTGTAHPRDSLATLLGGDVADDQARKLLSNVLTDLRRHLVAYLQLSPHTVTFLRDQPHWLDAVEFSGQLAGGLAAADSGPLQAAVALYRGEFLEGLSLRGAPDFDAWLVAQREAYHRQFVQALRALIDRAVHDRALEEGITAARRLLVLEPWLEEVHRQLMTLLAWAGQRDQALAQYETCRRALREELDAEPAAETTALYTRLRGAGQTPVHNVAAAATATVGREGQVALLVERLADPDYRLISLVGLGGSGKSRLAREVARQFIAPSAPLVEQPFPDGVYFVRLDEARPHDKGSDGAGAQRQLAMALARALRLPLAEPTDPTRQLYAQVRNKALLLVLDGFEAWLAALPVLTGLLGTARQVKLLVTSRVHLQLPQEHVLELGGLSLPATPADLEQAGASVLLLQAARRVQLDYQWPEAERAQVVRLCQKLGGLPLAIVLVAPWLRLLNLDQILDELERSLALLSTSEPTVPARHRDLLAVLQQSWERLPAGEQRAMRQLSVFKGGFDAHAASSVADTTLPLLLSLIQKGMLTREADGRYQAHALVVQCAAQAARSHPDELAAAQARHARHYADLLRELTPGLRYGELASERVRAEGSNVTAAWHWAAGQGAVDLLVQMSASLNLYWELGGLFEEAATMYSEAVGAGRAARATAPSSPAMQESLGRLRIGESYWLIQRGLYQEADRAAQEASVVASVSTSPDLPAEVAYCQGELAAHQLYWIEARPRLEQAVGLARAGGRWDLEARSLDRLAQAVAVLGEPETAEELLERALAIRQEQNDRVGIGQSLTWLCFVRPLMGNYEGARDAGEQALHWNRLVGARAGEVLALAFLGDVLSMRGHFTEAERCQFDAVRISSETGWRLYQPRCLIDLGHVERLEGDFASAHAHLEQALILCREIGSRIVAARAQFELSRVAHAQGRYHEAFRMLQEALDIVGPTGEQRQRREALVALGFTELSLERLPAAGAAYQAALSLARTWRARGPVIEATAGLAQVALLEGDLSQAQSHVATFVADLLAGPLLHVDDPAAVYLTAYETLQGLSDPRVELVLAAGYHLLEQRAAGIADEARRGLYLDAIPSNRLLVQAWRARRVD
jgi:DNA-binding SARP family transcriptional activator/predicted ATPase